MKERPGLLEVELMEGKGSREMNWILVRQSLIFIMTLAERVVSFSYLVSWPSVLGTSSSS